MKNLGMVFALMIAFSFSFSQVQAQSGRCAGKTSKKCVPTMCKKTADQATNQVSKAGTLVRLGDKTTTESATCNKLCFPGCCALPCAKKGTAVKMSATAKTVSNKTKKTSCAPACSKNKKVNNKVNTTKKTKKVVLNQ